jgi:hypothetical protein
VDEPHLGEALKGGCLGVAGFPSVACGGHVATREPGVIVCGADEAVELDFMKHGGKGSGCFVGVGRHDEVHNNTIAQSLMNVPDPMLAEVR